MCKVPGAAVAPATRLVPQAQQAPTPEAPRGAKLLQYVSADRWELVASGATPRFRDAKEDQPSSKPEFFLEMQDGEIKLRADEALQYVGDRHALHMTFAVPAKLWALRFPSLEAYDAFLAELQDKVFHNTYGVENDDKGRAKALGADYKDRFFAAAQQAEEATPLEAEAAETDRPLPGELQALKERTTRTKDGNPIKAVLLGATDNSYLQRGAVVEVMRNVEGGVEDKGISFTLKSLGAGVGGEFTPDKMLMAQFETKLNVLSASNPSTLFHADIECGKVVSEWRFEKDGVEIPQCDIVADHKAAQLGEESTFLGLDANRLCRWDMRDRRGVVQEASAVLEYEGGKDFAKGTNFSCMATSGDGHVVVGSADGKLRLYYRTTLTQAKTSIPGVLGKPITAVDVSYDGRWIVATTDDYLLVVKATYKEDGRERSAFTSRAGSRLALPRLLRLKPEDALRTGGGKFKEGKFTWVTEKGGQERWIVTHVGKYVVTWNFRRVKTTKTTSTGFGGLPVLMEYNLVAKDEEVVAAGFVHDSFTPVAGHNAMVVATPHKVFMHAS